MEMIRRFDPETFARGLEDWRWLIDGRDLQPIAASMFGDVFMQGEDGVWFLDCIEGTLTVRWPTAGVLQAELNTPEGQDQYLLGGIVLAAEQRGIHPGPAQVLTFRVPPALSGPISADNVDTMDYVVSSSIDGQLHRQLKDLPPGTQISGVAFDESSPA
ncbi:hypothetical protein [Rudaeicoccus suwonensis]|uniref:T6SS immunity protein Tdi1 C-terminal domain-containing protein n=1 Tax=Rudaeicoccus suwonensis TaxID=657409 RepID=A0A561EB22_9MICO|nr:hypothetical protein [Rudaeicoccus suwonensis]TWE12808.1 hypothetical protein BKA23_1626 [Rudaeicoccus suwonensis]